MQLKYPELLWALLLLLIPIIIHLFQLRRYKKTPFTNVILLQKVVSQTRKSQELKKWLLLTTRLLMFTSLILAFAQPYLAGNGALERKDRTIYLDDSFSMQAKTENGELLQMAVQDLIKGLPPEEEIRLFTNVETYADVTPTVIKNELIGLSHTYNQLSMADILLKASTLKDDEANGMELLVISDFQERMYHFEDSIPSSDIRLIQLLPETASNISIDSIFISNQSPTQLELKASLSSNDDNVETTPVSMWNADTLIAKTAANFTVKGKAEVIFSLPKDVVIDGKVEINDNGLNYDNQIYFNINKKEKIRVLSIGPGSSSFLERIYNQEEFIFNQFAINDLNYSLIERQNLVVLNQLNSIPVALQNALRAFTGSGGSIVVIPAENAELASYNPFLSNYAATRIEEKSQAEYQITDISFSHPLFDNVFEQTVSNFQYPVVKSYYKTSSGLAPVLRLDNGDPFLLGNDSFYIFTTAIKPEATNFMNSPLIVPTMYNMGALSLRLPALYHLLSSSTEIDIPISLPRDEIAKVVKDEYEFIPLQQSFSNKTSLDFEEYPAEDGIFDIVIKDSLISRISFNYPREESALNYADISGSPMATTSDNITDLLNSIENENKVKELWLPFVILALFFAIAEVLIQKLVK